MVYCHESQIGFEPGIRGCPHITEGVNWCLCACWSVRRKNFIREVIFEIGVLVQSYILPCIVIQCRGTKGQVNYFRFEPGHTTSSRVLQWSIGTSPCTLRGETQVNSISRSMVENRSKLMSTGHIIDRSGIADTHNTHTIAYPMPLTYLNHASAFYFVTTNVVRQLGILCSLHVPPTQQSSSATHFACRLSLEASAVPYSQLICGVPAFRMVASDLHTRLLHVPSTQCMCPHSRIWLPQSTLLVVAARSAYLSGTSLWPGFTAHAAIDPLGHILLVVDDSLFWNLSSYPHNFLYALSSS
jgi:hypothetical protein